MALKVTQVKVWAAGIEDRPGAAAAKLRTLADAGANLDFVIARRAPDNPGTGVVFVAPLGGRKQRKAAQAAGFSEAESLHSLRLEGPDKAGLGARVTEAVASAGINLRGLSAAAIGKRCVCYLAFNNSEDAVKAKKIVSRL